jgi:hypothetical protein
MVYPLLSIALNSGGRRTISGICLLQEADPAGWRIRVAEACNKPFEVFGVQDHSPNTS